MDRGADMGVWVYMALVTDSRNDVHLQVLCHWNKAKK